MHARNGRPVNNGDTLVQLGEGGKINAVGVLTDATPGNDYCNGNLVYKHPYTGETVKVGACMCDCLHVDDVATMLKEKGLDKRPPGK